MSESIKQTTGTISLQDNAMTDYLGGIQADAFHSIWKSHRIEEGAKRDITNILSPTAMTYKGKSLDPQSFVR